MLRATEDRITEDGGELEGYVMRRYEAIPARLLIQHDQFRNRLEMYCCLSLVFVGLGTAAAMLLARDQDHYVSAVVAATVLILLAFVSYQAAIASARGYCTVLRTIARLPVDGAD